MKNKYIKYSEQQINDMFPEKKLKYILENIPPMQGVVIEGKDEEIAYKLSHEIDRISFHVVDGKTIAINTNIKNHENYQKFLSKIASMDDVFTKSELIRKTQRLTQQERTEYTRQAIEEGLISEQKEYKINGKHLTTYIKN